jgi:hypothetical protein
VSEPSPVLGVDFQKLVCLPAQYPERFIIPFDAYLNQFSVLCRGTQEVYLLLCFIGFPGREMSIQGPQMTCLAKQVRQEKKPCDGNVEFTERFGFAGSSDLSQDARLGR